jgi:hypothetical protein
LPKYQSKQNRFAKRVKKEGILLVHDAPSPASLKAIPEADFGSSRSDAATTPTASRQVASPCRSNVELLAALGTLELPLERGRDRFEHTKRLGALATRA